MFNSGGTAVSILFSFDCRHRIGRIHRRAARLERSVAVAANHFRENPAKVIPEEHLLTRPDHGELISPSHRLDLGFPFQGRTLVGTKLLVDQSDGSTTTR